MEGAPRGVFCVGVDGRDVGEDRPSELLGGKCPMVPVDDDGLSDFIGHGVKLSCLAPDDRLRWHAWHLAVSPSRVARLR